MRSLLLSLLTASAAPPHAHGSAAHAQQPTERCSRHGRAVIRVRLVDPTGRAIAVPANAVIAALRCGAQTRPDGTAELAAVPAGRHGGSGATVSLLLSPAQAVTDAQGQYAMALEPEQAAAAACLEIAYSSALKGDTPGVPLRVPPAVPETLHVGLVGP